MISCIVVAAYPFVINRFSVTSNISFLLSSGFFVTRMFVPPFDRLLVNNNVTLPFISVKKVMSAFLVLLKTTFLQPGCQFFLTIMDVFFLRDECSKIEFSPNLPVGHIQNPFCPGCDAWIVGNQQNGCAIPVQPS